jgi:hypothetical protein
MASRTASVLAFDAEVEIGAAVVIAAQAPTPH